VYGSGLAELDVTVDGPPSAFSSSKTSSNYHGSDYSDSFSSQSKSILK
jgi:hypothetical protein